MMGISLLLVRSQLDIISVEQVLARVAKYRVVQGLKEVLFEPVPSLSTKIRVLVNVAYQEVRFFEGHLPPPLPR